MTELLQALSTAGWPRRLITLSDWEALPEDDGYRAEVSEGVMSVVPGAHPRHGVVGMRLGARLDPVLPEHAHVGMEAEVMLAVEPLTVRIPDVLVVTREAYEAGAPRFLASEVLVVVEVLSPGSARIDRVTKLSEYADAGIPAYWIVDLTAPVTLTRFELVDRAYVAVGTHRGSTSLPLLGVEVDVDLDALPR